MHAHVGVAAEMAGTPTRRGGQTVAIGFAVGVLALQGPGEAAGHGRSRLVALPYGQEQQIGGAVVELLGDGVEQLVLQQALGGQALTAAGPG